MICCQFRWMLPFELKNFLPSASWWQPILLASSCPPSIDLSVKNWSLHPVSLQSMPTNFNISYAFTPIKLVDYFNFWSQLWFSSRFQPRARVLKISKSKHAYSVSSAFGNWPVTPHRTWERSSSWSLLKISFSEPSYQWLYNNREEIPAWKMAAYFRLM